MSADSLPDALFRRAEATPEEPWLFYRRGWDWTWLPWRAVAERVALWSESLAPLPAGTRAAFAAAPSPATIALDLALQGAGLVAVPVPPELEGEKLAAALAERAEVWIEAEGWDVGANLAIKKVELGVPPPFTAPDLVVAARAVEALLPTARPGREILVSCRPLSDPAERQLLAWAIWTGAALLLEPDRSAGAATAVSARPTLFHGTAAEIAVLRRAVERRRFQQFRRGFPFGRLHTLLVDGALPAAERRFWEARGVRVAALPALQAA